MLLIAALLALLVGLSLGLLGGGGSILTVPILRYVLGVEAHEAIALSLLVVGTTSLAALIPHARRGRVRGRTGVIFGLAGMVGAFAAGRIAHLIPSAILLTAFGAMMFVTAFAMLRPKRASAPAATESESPADLPVAKVLAEGVVVGAVTGLVGAGGGFLVVPALTLLGGLSMELAVGTSLVVIAMKSLAGFAGFIGHTRVDWTLGLAISGSAVVGSIAGSLLVSRIPASRLRAAFGWFVVAMAFFILAQEIPALIGREGSLLFALLFATLGTLTLALLRRALRHVRDRSAPGGRARRMQLDEPFRRLARWRLLRLRSRTAQRGRRYWLPTAGRARSACQPDNRVIARALDAGADLLALQGANPHHLRAYRIAAASIRAYPTSVLCRSVHLFRARGEVELTAVQAEPRLRNTYVERANHPCASRKSCRCK